MQQTIYVVQAFERRQAQIVPAWQEPATTLTSARRRACRAAEQKAGAAAIEMVVDEETGVIDSARIIDRYGAVPDDLDATWGGM